MLTRTAGPMNARHFNGAVQPLERMMTAVRRRLCRRGRGGLLIALHAVDTAAIHFD